MNKIGLGFAIAAASAVVAAVAVSIIDKHRKEQLLREVYDLSEDDLNLVSAEDADEIGGETDSRVSEFAREQVVRESWHEDYPEEYEGWEGCWDECGEPDDAFAAYPEDDCGESSTDDSSETEEVYEDCCDSEFDEDAEYDEEEEEY